MPRNSSFLLSIVLVVILAPPVFSQLEEEVRVDLIEVWAKVTDKNNTVVTDLKPEDFSIYIDGKKMEMRCFDRVLMKHLQVAQEADSSKRAKSNPNNRVKNDHSFFSLICFTLRD